jgi:hypothetical protein
MKSTNAQASAHYFFGKPLSFNIALTALVEIPIEHLAVPLEVEEYGVVGVWMILFSLKKFAHIMPLNLGASSTHTYIIVFPVIFSDSNLYVFIVSRVMFTSLSFKKNVRQWDILLSWNFIAYRAPPSDVM